MNVICDETCTAYSAPGHPERPARISTTVQLFKTQQDLKLKWHLPAKVDDELILRAHSKDLLAKVDKPDGDFDGDTPAHANIAMHAGKSAASAVLAMQLARKGEPSFSLMRPPGHHATKNRAMGFCYLNGIAIAALEALATGTRNIGLLDFDVHHGNGTEDILLNQPHTWFASIHQHPCYPGTGLGNIGDNCFNYPVPPKTSRETYRKTIEQAIERLASKKPDLIAVSAGFDAYARDPLAQETLEEEDFHWIGERLRKLGIPFFSVLEGGYSSDLPKLILAYLKGAAGK